MRITQSISVIPLLVGMSVYFCYRMLVRTTHALGIWCALIRGALWPASDLVGVLLVISEPVVITRHLTLYIIYLSQSTRHLTLSRQTFEDT